MSTRDGWILTGMVAFLALVAPHAQAVDSAASGYWTNTATWSGGTIPGIGQSAVILNTHTVTVDVSSANLSALTVNSGGTLTFAGWNTVITSTTITVNGIVTHPPQNAATTNPAGQWIADNRVQLVCSDVAIAAGGQINADGRGYLGAPPCTWANTIWTNGYGPGGGGSHPDGGTGGGHGGQGGYRPGYRSRGGTNGDPVLADQPGSGGGARQEAGFGGNGGGAIAISASGTVTIDGSVKADGVSASHAGGAGGSVNIQCAVVAGIGTISANGGAKGSSASGAGGGGRVKLNHGAATGWSGTVQASAGAPGGMTPGAPGTLWVPTSDLLSTTLNGKSWRIYGITGWAPASLSLSNSFVGFEQPGFQLSVTTDVTVAYGSTFQMGTDSPEATNAPGLSVGGNMTVTGSTVYVYSGNQPTNAAGALVTVSGALTIQSATNYLFSHMTNGGSPWLTVRDLIVATNGVLSADSGGFRGGAAYSGTDQGLGPGGGLNFGDGGGGGSYGGRGRGRGAANFTYVGQTYGSSNAPILAGSGGGGGQPTGTRGGRGGGLIRVTASGNITVDGTMVANGGSGGWNGGVNSGGGSGGAIYLACRKITGAGSLFAKGGPPGGNSGGGGGGRIAVWRIRHEWSGMPSTSSNGTSVDGDSFYSSDPGTVFWGWSLENGTVFVVH